MDVLIAYGNHVEWGYDINNPILTVMAVVEWLHIGEKIWALNGMRLNGMHGIQVCYLGTQT